MQVSLSTLLQKAKEFKYQVYCDMDGVLTWFDRALHDLTMELYQLGYNFEQFVQVAGSKTKVWKLIGQKDGFWYMLWHPDGQKLWNALKVYNPIILTSPGGDIEKCKQEKRQWIKDNLGDHVQVLFTEKGKGKDKFASKNSILIDDMDKNITDWRKAGGIALKYQGDVEKTIKELQNIISKKMQKARTKKYIKRWRGKDGKWHYTYAQERKQSVGKKGNTQSIRNLVKKENKSFDNLDIDVQADIASELQDQYEFFNNSQYFWNTTEVREFIAETPDLNIELRKENPIFLFKQFGKNRKFSRVAVEKYKEQIKNGIEFDPVIVNGDKFLDGGHRVVAYMELGKKEIPVADIKEIMNYNWKKEVVEAFGQEILKAGTFSGYKLHKRKRFMGMNISVENRKGSYRHWKDDQGNEGKTKMLHDYGYIRGTEGKDGDHVDVFLGDNENAPFAFVVHQNRSDNGKYDEDKVMLGFDTAEAAKKAYLKHYDSIKFFGGMKAMPIDKFKERVYKTLNGKNKSLKAELHQEFMQSRVKIRRKVS